MHSRTKSSSSLNSSPKKRVSLGRTDSSRSGASDFTAGCIPSMAMVAREAHASSNAFYAQLLEAQKTRDEGVGHRTGNEKVRRSSEVNLEKRAASEEPVTALPPTSLLMTASMDWPNAPVMKTPRKKRPEGLQLVPENAEGAVPTQRALIEARKEKKIMSMLATDVPSSPAVVTFQSDPTTITYDSKSSVAKTSAGTTSPKKKFLGLNISVPSFMSGNSDVSQPVPMPPPPPPPAFNNGLVAPIPPAPTPPGYKKPANVTHTSLRKLADTETGELKREDAVSHLPSKVRQLKEQRSGHVSVEDSPTLGRYTDYTSARSVSDGVAAVMHGKKSHDSSQGTTEEMRRSKSVLHARDADTETIPPTPLPKDTPPKVVVHQGSPVKPPSSRPKASSGREGKGATPVKGVRHLRNDYLELISKSPSVYSLYGDIQMLPGSQIAAPFGCDTAKEEGKESETLKPTVYEGRRIEGQALGWEERGKQPHGQAQPSPPRQQTAPVAYSPSVYSTVWSPSNAKKQRAKATSILSQYSHFEQPTRSIHPSEESSGSSGTITFKASGSVLATANKAEASEEKPEEELAESTMIIHSCEDLLPSRELASSPSGNVTMPALHNVPVSRERVSEAGANGALSTTDGHPTSGSTNTDTSTNHRLRDSVSTSDYYPPDVPQYPNAMPTPLFGRHGQGHGPNMPTSPPLSFPGIFPTPPPGYPGAMMMQVPSGQQGMMVMPDGTNMLTHFDVLNRHIMDAAISLHQAHAVTRDQLLADITSKHADHKIASDGHALIMKESLDKVEQHVSASSATAENVLAKAEQLLEQVSTDFGGKLSQLTEQNNQMLSRLDALHKQVMDLGKNNDDNRSTIANEVVRVVQSNMTPYYPSGMSMLPAQPVQGQSMFMDQAGRMFTVSAGQAQQMQQMQGSGQPMYGSMAPHLGKEDRARRSDEFGTWQRGAAYGGEYKNRRGYDGFRPAADPRLHDGKGYGEAGTGHQRQT